MVNYIILGRSLPIIFLHIWFPGFPTRRELLLGSGFSLPRKAGKQVLPDNDSFAQNFLISILVLK